MAVAARPPLPARPARAGAAVHSRSGAALLVALLAACAYAAFAAGAVRLPDEARLQVLLALVAVAAAGIWVAGPVAVSAPAAAWWGAGLLAAFGLWCALSIGWSVMPDRSWQEANRTLAYALVIVLAIVAGCATSRAIERVGTGYVIVAAAVALYALAGKVAPGLVDHAGQVSRLRAPLEYWNALAAVCCWGVPVAVRLVADTSRRAPWRLAALAATLVLVVVIGLTYSRGAVLALAVAVAVMTALGGARLRSLLVLGAVAVAALPVLGMAFASTALTTNGAPLAQRIHDGRALGGVLIVALALLLAAGWGAMRLEPRVLARWSPRASRRTWIAAGVAAGVACVLALGGLAASQRGLGGSVSHAWHSFTAVHEDRQFDPQRLVSTNSGNRWVWWQEAAGAFSDRPLQGWGAGSFPVTHKLYRTNELPVSQPHNVPLQFLAETGLVGALLALSGIALLLWAAVGRVRSLPSGAERDVGAALAAVAIAWLVHGCFDWDWDIPGVTVPALLFAGVLCARPGEQRHGATAFADPDRELSPGRWLALGAAVLAVLGFAVSAAVPAWSDAKASAAQEAAGSPGASPASVEQAQADALVAADLDPTAVRPLFVAAAIAEGRGRLVDARRYLLEAVHRQPSSSVAWLKLAQIAFELVDRRGTQSAARRALALDPASGPLRAIAQRAEAFLAPPSASATATGTPLPASAGP
jgi:hypothetical protein